MAGCASSPHEFFISAGAVPMQRITTLTGLLAQGAASGTALEALGRDPLSYAALREQVAHAVEQLNHLGLGRGDRIAMVLHNGPDMAGAFLAVASAATACPLNPAYRAEEFEFFLSDLKAAALLVEAGDHSVAVEVARKLGVRVLTLSRRRAAGAFELAEEGGSAHAPAALGGPAEAGDVALVLHTSGTTSRPKSVPLTQANLCASACNVRDTLQLGPADRGLNIMPLFHIHGLVAGLLSPLAGGGQVFCSPGFNALKFFGWMQEARPTWYTAVATMHQAIVARAGHHQELIAAHPLRFLRSSSAAIPPQVIAALEEAFGAPLIESYGMTEAAHQMASNPLPPGQRKPGTVGLAAGPEVAIMDEAGQLLPPGSTGEIVIRGPNVTAGYENNPAANAQAFTHGWFRTGDQGVMDEQGYLSITGRLKEIINRGGEKISPREVDEVLLDHPAVARAVTFALPHPKLGEEVAAAVVLHEGRTAGERELRDFVGLHLADFKVPRRIVLVDDLPKGATGKVQRIGLAQKLGLVQ
jgi:acyl-CoA synthetase (AMP-forming)/AMP-acid ligase II